MSSQSKNISVSFSLTPSRDLSVTTRISAITELSSQGGFLASSVSSFETQNASLLIGEPITSPAFVTGFPFKRGAKKLTSKSRGLFFFFFLNLCNNLENIGY